MNRYSKLYFLLFFFLPILSAHALSPLDPNETCIIIGTETIEPDLAEAIKKSNNLTFLDDNGFLFGGSDEITFTWDGTSYNTDETDTNFDYINISSLQEFFGSTWSTHHIRIYAGPKTLSFDTTCSVVQLETGVTSCGGLPNELLTLDIPDKMIGAHMLFDWNGSINNDLINLWQQDAEWDDHGDAIPKNQIYRDSFEPFNFTGEPIENPKWGLVSRDINNDGINGSPMLEGSFIGTQLNFNLNKELPEAYLMNVYECTNKQSINSPSISAMNHIYLYFILLIFTARKYSRTTLYNS